MIKSYKWMGGWKSTGDPILGVPALLIIVLKFKLCRRSVFGIHPEILLCLVAIHLQILVKVLHHREYARLISSEQSRGTGGGGETAVSLPPNGELALPPTEQLSSQPLTLFDTGERMQLPWLKT